MKLTDVIEYIIIGALYLIPYFMVHYTFVCTRQNSKLGFLESIKTAYAALPNALTGRISLNVNDTKIPAISFLFLIIVIGIITNGFLHHLDEFWVNFLIKLFPNAYESNAAISQYQKEVEVLFLCKKEECLLVLSKINFQTLIARHGIAHSIILLLCLVPILFTKRLFVKTKIIWLVLILIISFHAAYGFLATKGWHEGFSNAIISVNAKKH